MDTLLKDVKTFVDSIQDQDYQDALNISISAVESVKELLQSIKSGEEAAVQFQLTGWEDVNRTLSAIGKMSKAIEDAKNGVQLAEVLEFIGKALKIAITLSALAA